MKNLVFLFSAAAVPCSLFVRLRIFFIALLAVVPISVGLTAQTNPEDPEWVIVETLAEGEGIHGGSGPAIWNIPSIFTPPYERWWFGVIDSNEGKSWGHVDVGDNNVGSVEHEEEAYWYSLKLHVWNGSGAAPWLMATGHVDIFASASLISGVCSTGFEALAEVQISFGGVAGTIRLEDARGKKTDSTSWSAPTSVSLGPIGLSFGWTTVNGLGDYSWDKLPDDFIVFSNGPVNQFTIKKKNDVMVKAGADGFAWWQGPPPGEVLGYTGEAHCYAEAETTCVYTPY